LKIIKVFKILITSIFILIFIFIVKTSINSYFFETKHIIKKYNNIPCQNKIFTLHKPRTLVVNGVSVMEPAYYLITRNSLEDKKHLYHHSSSRKIIKNTYSKGEKFKVISYYSAYSIEDYTTSGLGGGIVEKFLIQNIKDKKFFWIPYYEFDIKTCEISKSQFNQNQFDASKSYNDKNITVEILDTTNMKLKPFE